METQTITNKERGFYGSGYNKTHYIKKKGLTLCEIKTNPIDWIKLNHKVDCKRCLKVKGVLKE
jgi:hypothetical protein